LLGQSEQTNVTDSDRGSILELIQEASANDALVEFLNTLSKEKLWRI
jgi:hypothetical protein